MISREEINKISYPKTKEEALDILPNLKAVFGNCEEYSFELNYSDEQSVENISLLCDTYNNSIAIFRFYWLQESGEEKAIDCVSIMHIDTKDATRIADILKYYVTILKEENNAQLQP